LDTASNVVVATVKSIPAPFNDETVDVFPGGQVIFLTGGKDVRGAFYATKNPKEALRINEQQQVSIGVTDRQGCKGNILLC
jgi:hypothetical protein